MTSEPRPAAPEPAPGAASWLERDASLIAWVIAAGYVALVSPQLGTVLENFDEGVYIQLAAMVREGRVPYRDFFHHQTPLYLYALAAFSRLAPTSLEVHRLLSLLATALSGVVVMHAARRLVSVEAAFAAMLLFYGSPLQRYGMLAMPTGLMIAASVFGVYAVVFRSGRRWSLVGGAALALAVLFRPTTLPSLLAVMAVLLLARAQRHKLVPVIAAGALTGALAGLAFHLASDGRFTEVVLLQASRYARKSGFGVMLKYEPFRHVAELRGASTPVRWNVSELASTYFDHFPFNMNLWLPIVAAAGALRLVTGGAAGAPAAAAAGEADRRTLVLMAALWLALSLSFSLFVWEPIWDHYFLEFVAPLSLLAAGAVDGIRHRRGRHGATGTIAARLGVGAVLLSIVGLGIATRPQNPKYFERARALPIQGASVMSFEPLLTFLGQAKPACGLVDPFNVLGQDCAASLQPDGPLSRFVVSESSIVDCLERQPEVRVLVGPFFHWFNRGIIARYLRSLDGRRLVFLAPEDRARFEADRGRLARTND